MTDASLDVGATGVVRPAGDAVVIRVVRSIGVAHLADATERRLPAPQRERLARLRLPQARADYLAARLHSTELVAGLVGVGTARVRLHQSCPTCRGADHGRPYATVDGRRRDDIALSWSHSDGVIAAAAGRHVQVGIDVERSDDLAPPDPKLMRAGLSDAELRWAESNRDAARAFLNLWTRKEALVKLGCCTLDDVLQSSVGELVQRLPGVMAGSWLDRGTTALVGLAVIDAGRTRLTPR